MKPADSSDPMEFIGVGIPGGDVDAMAECLIEEYLLMGWNDRQLMGLFTRPFFRATHQIYRARGEAQVRSLIARVRAKYSGLAGLKEVPDA